MLYQFTIQKYILHQKNGLKQAQVLHLEQCKENKDVENPSLNPGRKVDKLVHSLFFEPFTFKISYRV